MGRLQKKKPATKKKKKNQATGSADNEQQPVAKAKQSPKPALMTRITAPATTKAGMAKNRTPGVVQKSIQFLREVKVELKKVTWPTRKQTLGSTAVVIVLVMIISLFLGMVDIGLSSLVSKVLQ
jgi:preprotein translocase subunit SecE